MNAQVVELLMSRMDTLLDRIALALALMRPRLAYSTD